MLIPASNADSDSALPALPGGVAPTPGAGTLPTFATDLLTRLWQQSLPVMRKRVHSLEAAAHAAAQGKLTAETHQEATDVAHKLAGSLGMFGFPKGTELAREIEHLLEASPSPDAQRLTQLTADLRHSLPL